MRIPPSTTRVLLSLPRIDGDSSGGLLSMTVARAEELCDVSFSWPQAQQSSWAPAPITASSDIADLGTQESYRSVASIGAITCANK